MIDNIVRAFGAVEIARVVGEDGTIGHAEARIRDAMVMLFDSRPDWPPTPTFLRLYVDNAEATHRSAVAAGGTVTDVTHLALVRDRVLDIWVDAVADALAGCRADNTAGFERVVTRLNGPERPRSSMATRSPRSPFLTPDTTHPAWHS